MRRRFKPTRAASPCTREPMLAIGWAPAPWGLPGWSARALLEPGGLCAAACAVDDRLRVPAARASHRSASARPQRRHGHSQRTRCGLARGAGPSGTSLHWRYAWPPTAGVRPVALLLCGHGVCAWRLSRTRCVLACCRGQCAVPAQRGDADAATQQQCARFVSVVFAGALWVCAARAGVHASLHSLHASMLACKRLPERSALAPCTF